MVHVVYTKHVVYFTVCVCHNSGVTLANSVYCHKYQVHALLQTPALLKRGIRNSGITELDNIKMADDSYANKSRWRALLPRKVRISNESKGNGYIDNCLEVVCAEMLLRMKTAAHRSFLAQKPQERPRTTHYPLNGRASVARRSRDSFFLAAYTAYLVPTPSTRQAFGRGSGGIN